MIGMRLSDAVPPLNATLNGADVDFQGCSTDSRTLRSGELFIALRGERFDGHDCLAQARERGASAAMVEHENDQSLPLLVVEDTRRGLGKLAASWRRKFQVPVVAVTGSNGKTTVKEMLASILGVRHAVLATQGNLNNDIGVPLTLFRFGDHHAYAVIEMGANHPGEIQWLTDIVAPTVGVVTVCAPSHLEGFGDLEGVARAKGELFAGIGAQGIAVVNADDPFSGLWREMARGGRCISFAVNTDADVMGTDLGIRADGSRSVRIGAGAQAVEFNLQLLGQHNVSNAIAATACAHAIGIAIADCRPGLERVRPLAGRLELKRGVSGMRLIDDSYNANPASLAAGLNALAEMPGEHWLVLGDMGELGDESRRLHAEAGRSARAAGVSRLFAFGEQSALAVAEFGDNAYSFKTMEPLVDTLKQSLNGDLTVLVKGSRAMHMERVVRGLQAGE